MDRRALIALGLAASSLLVPAHAQEWPTRTVRIIVPFAAGGATDIPARLLAERLSRTWKQQVLVENRAGAGGSLGATEAARASDGHTLFFPSGSVMTASPYVYPKLSYDPERDFAPITIVVSAPQVLVVPATSPFTTVDALIRQMRQQPKALSFGHAGVGSQSHLGNEYFLQQARAEATGIPYRGDPLAVTDMLGGKLDFAVLNMGAVVQHVRAGKLRALAVTSTTAVPQLPGVPTLAATLPDFENSGWFGLVVPSSMPQAAQGRIAQDVRAVLAEAEVRERLEDLGYRIVSNTPAAMGEIMAAERRRWSQLVKERNIRAE